MSFEELNREVKRDLQIEQIRKYLPGIITLIVSIVIGLGGYQAYQYYLQQQQLAASALFFEAEQAYEQNQLMGLTALEEVMQNDSAFGYQELAQFRVAGILLEQGKQPEAREVLLDLANRPETPSIMVTLATLYVAFMENDPAQAHAISNRLKPLTSDDTPWRHLARLAELELTLASGKNSKAVTLIDTILADAQTPVSIKIRLENLKGLVIRNQ